MTIRPKALIAAAVFVAGLAAIALWRVHEVRTGGGSGPTLAFVAWTVVFIVNLPRAGVDLGNFGFFVPPRPLVHFLYVLAGVALIKLFSEYGLPLLAGLIEPERDLSRFDGSITSLSALLAAVALSWVLVTGEELAFRVVLLRALLAGLGDGRGAAGLALVLQALVFGLVHAYQGPAGIVGTTFSGLVYGALVLSARGCIWPAVIAHGLNNTHGFVALYTAT